MAFTLNIIPLISSNSNSFFTNPSPLLPTFSSIHNQTHLQSKTQSCGNVCCWAVRRWQDEYEDAVKDKNLGKALDLLKSRYNDEEEEEQPSSFFSSKNTGFGGGMSMILDTCLNADDMKMVASAYGFLQSRGYLPSFGKMRNTVLEGPREVTPTILKTLTGLEATELSPKKWGLSGSSSVVLIGLLGGISLLIYKGIDVRPNIAAVLGLAWLDSVFLGGCCVAQVSCLWPPYRRRVLVHEAGHLLTAYLLGCPVRGVILEPIIAIQMGIQGQAGTQFWDQELESELKEGKLSSAAFNRYCMVLFAGIAAEALVYGNAEGGENDENLFRSICLLLKPPLSTAQMSNQARWSVAQSYNLLKRHKAAHRAAFKALDEGKTLGTVIRKIEETLE